MTRPIIICLTPVRNEAWILKRFLDCASLWADHIIIADQNSTDGTPDIARIYPKVIYVRNDSDTYDEYARQKLLLDAARQIPGQRFLMALDADEILTANYQTSPEWQSTLASAPGTIVCFRWANLSTDMQSYWDPLSDWQWGFMDDGSQHEGYAIHSPRIPLPLQSPNLLLRDVRVMHYQYTEWERMSSKHRWYQCWERINHPNRRAVSIYRQYHHMYAIDSSALQPMPREWIRGYESQGIDMTSVTRLPSYYWDEEVLHLFAQYGVQRFRRESIWDVDWSRKATQVGFDAASLNLNDPRSSLDKAVQRWLRYTRSRANRFAVRLTHMALSLMGY